MQSFFSFIFLKKLILLAYPLLSPYPHPKFSSSIRYYCYSSWLPPRNPPTSLTFLLCVCLAFGLASTRPTSKQSSSTYLALTPITTVVLSASTSCSALTIAHKNPTGLYSSTFQTRCYLHSKFLTLLTASTPAACPSFTTKKTTVTLGGRYALAPLSQRHRFMPTTT